MQMMEPAYFSAFKNLAFSRTQSGVLTVRFHTDGNPATFTGQMHTDFPRALHEIGEDRDNRVLILTGTGGRFMTDIDGPSLGDIIKPAEWDETIAEGRPVMQRLRQRVSRRIAEGTALGMALEGLSAADLAYQS
jgi:enoyl-CoA hydratase/carnithine racemase